VDTLGDIPLEDVFERFDDALAFLRARTPMPAEQFYALEDQARQKAFTVSNVGQMDIVQQVLDSLEKALETGLDLKAWKDEIGVALREAWAGAAGNPAWRLETIYRTNIQTAFSHGRVRQMRDPAVTALRPFFLFDAILDGRTTDECSARDGVLLPADDPWWLTNTPPIHHACRSGIRSLRKSQADRRGGVNPPDREVELSPPGAGFGAAPTLSPAVQVKPFVPEVTGHPALEGARLRKEREFAEAEEERRRQAALG
jgi:SPP1 gp7 family putative phage head morphogenesis protein